VAIKDIGGSGGIIGQVSSPVAGFGKDTGSIARLLAYYETHQFKHPSSFCNERQAAG